MEIDVITAKRAVISVVGILLAMILAPYVKDGDHFTSVILGFLCVIMILVSVLVGITALARFLDWDV